MIVSIKHWTFDTISANPFFIALSFFSACTFCIVIPLLWSNDSLNIFASTKLVPINSTKKLCYPSNNNGLWHKFKLWYIPFCIRNFLFNNTFCNWYLLISIVKIIYVAFGYFVKFTGHTNNVNFLKIKYLNCINTFNYIKKRVQTTKSCIKK